MAEADVPAELAQSFAFFGEGSDLLGDLPADSWVALGQKDLGKLIGFYEDAFAAVAGGRDAIEGQFKAATGLDLQQDVLSWMGDFGIFVRGTSLASLDGALVVQTSDEAKSERFLAALAHLARTQSDSGTQIQRRRGGYTVAIRGRPEADPCLRRERQARVRLRRRGGEGRGEPGRLAGRLAGLHRPSRTRSATTTSRSTSW